MHAFLMCREIAGAGERPRAVWTLVWLLPSMLNHVCLQKGYHIDDLFTMKINGNTSKSVIDITRTLPYLLAFNVRVHPKYQPLKLGCAFLAKKVLCFLFEWDEVD